MPCLPFYSFSLCPRSSGLYSSVTGLSSHIYLPLSFLQSLYLWALERAFKLPRSHSLLASVGMPEFVLLVLSHAQPHNTIQLQDFRNICRSFCPIAHPLTPTSRPGFLVLRQVECNLAFWTLLTGTLRPPVSVSAEICVSDDICVHVDVCLCASWHQILHPVGVLGGMHCKQIFVGISKSLEHVFYTILSFSLSHTHTHIGRHINTCTHTFIHISYVCWPEVLVSLSLCVSLHRLCHLVSLATPFPDSGASCLLYCFQEVGKTSLEFPCLPGGENRLRCHPCPNLSPRWSGKQTAELPDRSGGGETCGLFEQSPRREMEVLYCRISSWFLSLACHSFVISSIFYLFPSFINRHSRSWLAQRRQAVRWFSCFRGVNLIICCYNQYILSCWKLF